MAHGFQVVAFLTLWLSCAVHATYNLQERCSNLTPEVYAYNSTRQVLEYLPAGTNLTFSDNDPTCSRPNQTVAVDLCRVALSIPTSNRSSITFEIWLPENWSGRFLATGNGGIDGCKLRFYLHRIYCGDSLNSARQDG